MRQLLIFILPFLFISANGQTGSNSLNDSINKNQAVISDTAGVNIILMNNKTLVKTYVLDKTETASLENYVDLYIMLNRTQRFTNIDLTSRKTYLQYLGCINNKGEKECYVICFSEKVKNKYSNNWRNKALMISDYMDDDYFSFIINFDKRCIEGMNCCR